METKQQKHLSARNEVTQKRMIILNSMAAFETKVSGRATEEVIKNPRRYPINAAALTIWGKRAELQTAHERIMAEIDAILDSVGVPKVEVPKG